MKETDMKIKQPRAQFHLPGLFEFYDFYAVFLPLFFSHREYFYDWCDIGSIYGAPGQCIWGGGRAGYGDADPLQVKRLLEKYHISARLTFSNSLLTEEHLSDHDCNLLCALFENSGEQETGVVENKVRNGIFIYSALLLSYIREKYPSFYFVSSTTKVITNFDKFKHELDRPEFSYVVPDFRLNKRFTELEDLRQEEKEKTEFLVNECCSFGCPDRKACYEAVSRVALGIEEHPHMCVSNDANEGYKFSNAMKNPGFISVEAIQNTYMPMGFSNFKIEGRSLGSALLLEFILYYMTKPEYQINVREEIYLDNELDLF